MKSYQFGLIFSLLITFTISRSVKFGLVAFGTKVKVKINDTAYTMTRPNIKDPYFTLTKDVSDDELM